MEASEGQPIVQMYSPALAERDVDLGGAIARVLNRHRYVLGAEVAQFEAAFADYCETEHCIGVANGTDALEIALRALDVGPGDTVAVVANAGGYSSAAVRAIGASPLFIDIDAGTRTMSPAFLRAAVGLSIDAIIVTHLYGQLADIDAISRLAATENVPLIEDCAQAHGARRGSQRAGAFGAIGCYSFYPSKNLGAAGDGGALVTADAALARRIRSLRQYGWSEKYVVEKPGGRNSRLDEIQAAVLNDKLPFLDRWNEERRRIAHRYVTAFRGLPLTLPSSLDEDFVAHLFVIEVDQRDAFRAVLSRRGVATDVHYPVPDHRQPAWASPTPPNLPITERACARVVSLPCYQGMSEDDVGHVIDVVSEALGATARAARA